MAEYQIMAWRDLPSMLTVREGEDVVKVQLAARFQEAIDEAAMRLGATGSDDYLTGWTRSEWTAAEGDPREVAEKVGAELESRWDGAALSDYLDAIGPSAS